MSTEEISQNARQLAQEWQAGTYEWWPAADRLIWSPELVAIHGLGEAPAAERGLIGLVHPEDRARVENAMSGFLGSNASRYSHSFRIVRPDGAVRVILDRGAIERDAVGTARVVRGINIDVTDEDRLKASESDQQAADAGLREREPQLQRVVRAAQAIIFEWDIRTDRVWRILSEDPVLPVTADRPDTFGQVVNAVHPDDRAAFRAAVEAALHSTDGAYRSEYRIAGPDGEVRWLAENGQVEFDDAGEPVRLLGISRDVTDRKQAQQELTEANALLESLFANAPVGLGVFDLEFRYVRVNRELAAINGVPREAHIGRRPDEILPDLADIDEMYRRWRQILETGEPWRGVEVSVEIPAQPGRRYCAVDYFPVRIGARNVGIAAIVQEITGQKAAEERSRVNEARYRTLFEAIDEGFFVMNVRLDAPDGRVDLRIVEANPAFYDQTGLSETILGRWLREATPELEEHWYEIYSRVARTGESVRFERCADMLGRWFDVYAFRIDAPQDHRIAVLFSDISDRKRQEEHNRLLMHELNHRSKNMLSLVQAVARQTASTGAKDFLERFGARVQALADAQDLLVQNAWKTVPLADLVRSQLAHFSDLVGERIEIAGPPLSLTPDATQALAMAFHELATNAAKHGALSNDTGRVVVLWSLKPDTSPEPRLTLSWLERGGPTVTKPERRGFGSTVTTTMVESSTRGEVSVEYAPAGVAWRLTCPVANVLDRAPTRPVAPRPAPAAARTGGQRVLVVEDEPAIAAYMTSILTDAGFSVLGPAGDVGEALDLLERVGCDAALLDMNLGDETSEAVARELTARRTPFVVVSGYSKALLPEVFRAAPLVSKPFRAETLEGQLRRALDRRSDRE